MSGEVSLKPLFKPRSVALVGASDRNPWCGLALQNLLATGFDGPVHLINKSGSQALGRATVTSCAAIGAPVDAAFIAVPAAALGEAIEDLAAGGIRYGVVVTSGFAELGGEGAAEQDRLFARAAELGVTLFGPNSLGFLNFADGSALGPLPMPQSIIDGGRVAIISQSGATTHAIQEYAARQGIGVAYAVALGNEAQVDLAQTIEFMIDDDRVSAIAVYAETIRNPDRFIAACERALELAKPILVLKVGAGEVAASVAQAHTGALVGDDRIFDAVCRRHGVIRVRSLEQMMNTAHLLTYTGVMDPRPVAALSMSGGACGMIADLLEAADVPFAPLSAATRERLKAILPAYGTPNNPLDITGAAMADQTIYPRSIEALGTDPDIGLILCIQDLPMSEEERSPLVRMVSEQVAEGFAAVSQKALLIGQTARQVTAFGRDYAASLGIPFVGFSMYEIAQAIGAGRRWSARVREGRAAVAPRTAPTPLDTRPMSERATLDYLASCGVPVIPARVVNSAEAAKAAAQDLGGKLAMKILSPDIAHKTDVGGVALDVCGQDQAAAAYASILASVAAAKPDARVEGVIVSPMRDRDVELFVGIARDPDWGLALAVGLGGIWVELLSDVSLRTLPVTPADVIEMLGELKAGKLLDGYRGRPAVDREAVAHVIARIGDAALALGPDLVSLEINPLNSGPSGIEALDGLVIWKPQS